MSETFDDVTAPDYLVMESIKKQKISTTTDHLMNEESILIANPNGVDFFTRVNPSHLVLDWLSNYEFYCVIPSLSQSHRSLMQDDALHQRHCKNRLAMTQSQFKLFCQSRFPLLYIPLDQISTIAEAHNCILQEKSSKPSDDSALSSKKIWWLECTRIFLHLSFATRYLTRHAPTSFSFANGRECKIKYELPRLIQSVLIDELTSFYVFNLLRRYQEDGYHDNYVFEQIQYGSLEGYPAKVWQDYSNQQEALADVCLDDQDELFGEICWEDESTRLNFLCGEAIFLGDSHAHGCGAWEYSQYLWMGPSLKAADDALKSTTEHVSTFVVNLETAVPFQWDIKNGEYLPYILAKDSRAWILQGGMSRRTVKDRELFRLYKFIYGEQAIEHCQVSKTQTSEPAERNCGETTYSNIAHQIEHQSQWWSEEQQMWKDYLVSTNSTLSRSESTIAEEEDEEEESDEESIRTTHTHADMFQTFLKFVCLQNSQS